MKFILSASLIAVILACCLFSGFAQRTMQVGWLRMVCGEIQAACRDAGTQWMVVVCLLSYLIVFVVLEAKSRVLGLGSKVGEQETERPTSNAQNAKPNDSGRESKVEGREREGLSLSSNFHPPSSSRRRAISYLLTSISSPAFWLGAFVALVLLRYAFDYTNAAKTLQLVVLVTGIVVGKGIALWAGAARRFKFQVSSVQHETSGRVAKVESREPAPVGRGSPLPAALVTDTDGAHGVTRPTMILSIIVFLLACASRWHPERGMEFQYRGQPRWTGPWDNPNLFGVLMGVGVILAGGLVVQRLRSKVQGREAEAEGREPGQVGRGSPLPAVGGASVRASRLVRSLAPPEEAGAHGVTRPTINSAYWSRAYRFLFSGFLLSALVLCAYGLVKSYSRGAWLGTAVGIGYSIWKWFNREPREIREQEIQPETPLPVGRGERGGAHGVTRPTSQLSRICRISRWNGNWFPISVFLLSAFVLSFWQFRHTEAPLARRVFSVGNPNDFSWRNRVAAWEGAGRMMLARPIIGFGWGKAEEVYSKEYRAARLEESAAIQMNDYLMIGISVGGPALVCLLIYLGLVLRCSRVGRGRPLPAALVTATDGAHGVTRPTIHLQVATIAASSAIVLLVGFWFDGGLFKLPTCVVFWVLVELGRAGFLTANDAKHANAEGGASVRASRLFSSLAPPAQGGAHGVTRPTIVLRWLAAITALGALVLTALHLGTPQFAVSERTLSIARKFLVPPGERNDFDFLAARPIWSNTPLKLLLQHAHLANYNRTLVNWKLDEPMYREFVLSPEINFQPSTSDPQPSEDFGWRRPLWEHFYPRIRKESSLEAAAEIVGCNLNELHQRRSAETQTQKAEVRSQTPSMGKSIAEIWQQPEASDAEFVRLSVAAWRAVGIPARLTASGQAEFWNGTEWRVMPRPVALEKAKS